MIGVSPPMVGSMLNMLVTPYDAQNTTFSVFTLSSFVIVSELNNIIFLLTKL